MCKLPALTGSDYCRHHQDFGNQRAGWYVHTPKEIGRFSRLYRSFITRQRWHVATVAVVFLITLLLSRPGRILAVRIEIPDATASSLTLAIPQVLGAFLALLIAYLLFQIERIENDRREEYRAFRTQAVQLLSLARDLPDSLPELKKPIADMYDSLRGLNLEALPLIRDEWDLLHVPFLSFMDAFDEVEDRMTFHERAYGESLLALFANMEETRGGLGLTYISLIITKSTIDVAVRMIAVVAVSLVLALAFGTRVVSGSVPDVNLPIVVALVTWTILLLLELISFLGLMYHGAQGEWQLPA